mmetsp:Transcript_1735/g.3351  ORF Transcript_1735/g.3351 Transcript_1735/m.3351 type:complete len:206 (+) Transcript_1735:274-891(+)
MCEHMNHRNRMAQQVGRSSSALFTLLFFREKDVIEEGIVLSVRKNGIRVFIPKFGIEGSIAVAKGGGGEAEKAGASSAGKKSGGEDDNNGWIFDGETLILSNPTLPGSPRYQIFDRLRVRIYVKRSEMRREWLEMEIPGTGAAAEKGDAKKGGGDAKMVSSTAGGGKKRAAAAVSPSKDSKPKRPRRTSAKKKGTKKTKKRQRGT